MGLDEAKRQEALEKIRQFKLKLPEGFKFDRDEANSRGNDDDVSDALQPRTSNPSQRN